MNEYEKIRLAEYIADLVVKKLNNQFDLIITPTIEEIDNDVEIQIDDLLDGNTEINIEIEEHLIAELARLTTLLTIYEDKEQYEKAAIITNKIRIINKKLDND
jgi:protein-arginine kinase activator protein McsA